MAGPRSSGGDSQWGRPGNADVVDASLATGMAMAPFERAAYFVDVSDREVNRSVGEPEHLYGSPTFRRADVRTMKSAIHQNHQETYSTLSALLALRLLRRVRNADQAGRDLRANGPRLFLSQGAEVPEQVTSGRLHVLRYGALARCHYTHGGVKTHK